ncbi:hypothetical protein ACWA7J_09620 [Leptothrix sp. BB-4]
MPKGKHSDLPLLLGWGFLLFFVFVGSTKAQAPSLLDVVETAKQVKLQELSKSLTDAYKQSPTPEMPVPKPTTRSIEPPMVAAPVQALPSLRAIYGVNQLIEAELVLDGVSYSIYSDEVRIEVGPWTYGHVFRDGVVLSRLPLNSRQVGLLAGLGIDAQGRMINCNKLGLKNSNCLILTANKASSGLPAPVAVSSNRSSSPNAGNLPPLPLPR